MIDKDTMLRHARRELAMCRMELRMTEESATEAEMTPLPDWRGQRGTTQAIVLEAALREWALGVQEPPGTNSDRITEYIRTRNGLGWDWERPYIRNGQFAWCGAFAAFCLGSAGLSFEIRFKHLASTRRLRRWLSDHPDRGVDRTELRPGDVMVVGPADEPTYGAHITIVREVSHVHSDSGDLVVDGNVLTYEGNARGVGPDGTRHEGVVQQSRPLTRTTQHQYAFTFAVRFKPEDFA